MSPACAREPAAPSPRRVPVREREVDAQAKRAPHTLLSTMLKAARECKVIGSMPGIRGLAAPSPAPA